MIGTFVTWLATALSLLVVDLAVPGVDLVTFPAAIIAAVSIGLINSLVKPTVSALSLPINFLSLGTFSLIVNGFCFWLASVFVPGFAVHGLAAFILGPILLSFVNTFLSKYIAERHPSIAMEGSSDLTLK